MTRPRLVDLFCKAGGATRGYQRAGFHVTGIDKDPQPNYAGDRFVQADAIVFLERMVAGGTYEWLGPGLFDAVHASPPCQLYIRSGNVDREKHPDLLGPTRDLLVAWERKPWGAPWVIENVPGSPMRADVMLCGSQFGLEVRRHRWFEFSQPPTELTLMAPCDHSRPITGVYGHPHGADGAYDGMLPGDLATWSRAMGINWMTTAELADAIPPAYTEYIGAQLIAALKEAA